MGNMLVKMKAFEADLFLKPNILNGSPIGLDIFKKLHEGC